MQKNKAEYGDLSLKSVQAIAERLYQTKTLIDTDSNIVMISSGANRKSSMVAFKPTNNPRHTLEVFDKCLKLEGVKSFRSLFIEMEFGTYEHNPDDPYNSPVEKGYEFLYVPLEFRSVDITTYEPDSITANTIWKACAALCMRISQDEAINHHDNNFQF